MIEDKIAIKAQPAWLACRQWLLRDALPLWADKGFDASRNAFQERLTFSGDPATDVPQRLMVQARQIYCYSTAQANSWMSGAGDLVTIATRSMVRNYYQADGQPGWVMSIDAQGSVLDSRRDLYAHAFVLLGLAAAFRSSNDEQYLALAEETLAFLDREMAQGSAGYLSTLPQDASCELRQNPHMHLLEGLLGLYAAAPSEQLKARCDAVVSLLHTTLFDPSSGILREYFNYEWAPAAGERGRVFEPGHHYEWVWLLHEYARTFQCDLPPVAALLLEKAAMFGHSPGGLLWTEVRDDGLVTDRTLRLWPHTEAIKASLYQTIPNASTEYLLTLLHNSFLRPTTPGGWIDRISPDGTSLVDHMPASSFYHIVCAFSEYERLAG